VKVYEDWNIFPWPPRYAGLSTAIRLMSQGRAEQCDDLVARLPHGRQTERELYVDDQ
jgi:hypothetical protein